MAQLVVRNLEQAVKDRLARRAKQHGQSLEAEVRDILRDAARREKTGGGLGSEIASDFRGIGFREGEIQEFRGGPPRPARFGR